MSRAGPKSVDNIDKHIRKRYWKEIHRNTLPEEEPCDLIETTRILSLKRATLLRDEEIIRQEDVCWCLSMLCVLPLWPKPSEDEDLHESPESDEDERDGEIDDADHAADQHLKEMEVRRIIRKEIIMYVSDTNELPVTVPQSVFSSEQPSVLDFELEQVTLRENVLLKNINNTIGMVESARLDSQQSTTRNKDSSLFELLYKSHKENTLDILRSSPEPIISWFQTR